MNSIPILLLFCSGLLGQPSREHNYNAWQITAGRSGIPGYYPFWEGGFHKYHYRDRQVLRYGINSGFHYNTYENNVDFSKPVRMAGISVGNNHYYIMKESKNHFLRLKLQIESGYKLIKFKKYTSDLLLNAGIGSSVYSVYKYSYYNLDSLNYPIDDLKYYRNIRYFYRPGIFFGLRNIHFLKLAKKLELFIDGMVAYNLALQTGPKRKYNSGLFLELRFGLSILK